MTRIATLLLFCLIAADAAHAVGFNGYRGLWFDRARPGHGIDIQPTEGTYLAIVYTFDAQGEPEWFAAQGAVTQGVLDADALRFRYDPAARRAAVERVAGRFTMRWDAAASDAACAGAARTGASELATLVLVLDGEGTSWCLEPLLPPQILPEAGMSGTWWGGETDSGWGLGTAFIPQAGGSMVTTQLLYYYDAAGAPRWAYGDRSDDDFVIDSALQSPRGYCRSCAVTERVARAAGTLHLEIVTPRRDVREANRIELRATYPGAAGGRFERSGALQRFSDTHLYGGSVATREGVIAPDIYHDDSNHDVYLGIPYAAPPTGANRWRAPQPPALRHRVLPVVTPTPGCEQPAGDGALGTRVPTRSEDCLTLNVWVPALPQRQPLPVMVWIHGGGLIQGSSLETLAAAPLLIYEGATLAVRDVVFVSLNYRLGPLGFLGVREFSGEHADYAGSGNYGFLDQVAALRWVRDNIAQFGGDPGNVTIFGESAGGVSVCGHMVSPLSRGLFHRAIMQSGTCARALPLPELTVGTQEATYLQGDRIAARLGCTDAATRRDCLRGKGAAEIITAGQPVVGFGRTGETYSVRQDGIVFDRSPATALADGSAARVPFLIGVNEDEATTLLAQSLRPQSTAQYESMVRSLTPLIADQVLARYPASAYSPVWRAYAAIVTDVGFICPAQRAARDHAANGNSAYAYYLTQHLDGDAAVLGAFHGLDVPLLFALLLPSGPGVPALADRMRGAWTRYAADGQPQAIGMPSWPVHPAQGALGMELNGNGDRVVSGYRREYCEFWARYIDL